MKKIVYFALILLISASCVGRRSVKELQGQKDSLQVALQERDSIIGEVFSSLNNITENLNLIKSRENIITYSISSASEIKKSTTAQMSEDIASIDSLLQKNKSRLSALERMLNKSNIKIASLEKLIKEMSVQIENKNKDILALNKELALKSSQIVSLNEKVDELGGDVSKLSSENKNLSGEVRSKTELLNSAYYIIGSEKELVEKEIVYKSGFIGRTLKINENRSLDSFTPVDIRNFDEVIIGKKKMTVVSYHPSGSYEIVKNDKGEVLSLTITDRDKFWQDSKVLIIAYK